MNAKILPDTWLRPYLFLEEALGEKAFGSEDEYGKNNSLTCNNPKTALIDLRGYVRIA